MDLFVFSDASQRAYGYSVYSLQKGDSNLIFAKVRSAPLKNKRTLPQLELLAAKLSVEGLCFLISCFSNVNNVYLGVDAQIVLAWLTSPINTKQVYTSNKIKDTLKFISDIKDKYEIKVQLRYVPTDCNPADLLTRGLSLQQFKDNLKFWLKGPLFIRTGGEIAWPSADLRCLSDTSKAVVCTTLIDVHVPSPPLVCFERFSKLPKLINCIKIVIKFLAMKKILKEETMERIWGTVDIAEIAKLYLLKKMQDESFPKELSFLKESSNLIPNRVKDLNLFLDPIGLIRSGGRMEHAGTFSPELIHPLVLGKHHALTNLIIKHCHHKVQHLGVQPTLNRVRMDGFRLIRPFSSVYSVLRNCFICKRMNSLSFKYPKMTDLPAYRVNLIRPFEHSGIDYTGHIMVKNGEVELKYYLLIYSCLNTRACSIDLLPDMSAEHFVLSLIRFTNLYGIPDSLYSDNAATFSAGVVKLKQVLQSKFFNENFGTSNIKHRCIPLGAPWVGSCWERTIKTIKDCLKKTIGRRKLDYFKYVTVLSDVQLAVNSRPLTYRCADNNDLEVITPLNFLNPYGRNTLLVKDSAASYPRNRSGQEFADSLTLRDELLDRFREIWSQEYLTSLRDSYKDLRQENFIDKIKINDIVLIKNIQPEFVKRRHYWSLARVLDIIKGHDGCIRSALVLKGSADYLSKKREPEIHPVKHLYPVELSLTHQYAVPIPSKDSPPMEIVPGTDVREDSVFDTDVQDSVIVDTESDSAPAVLRNRRGRVIRPPRAHADFLPFE